VFRFGPPEPDQWLRRGQLADQTAFGAALTQHFPDIPDRENAKKAPDTRTNLKLGRAFS
jgi:hypothetical protein